MTCNAIPGERLKVNGMVKINEHLDESLYSLSVMAIYNGLFSETSLPPILVVYRQMPRNLILSFVLLPHHSSTIIKI